MKRKRVTYVESSRSGISGGSHQSLITLLKNIDRDWIDPSVIVFQPGWYVKHLEALDFEVRVLPLSSPQLSQVKAGEVPNKRALIHRARSVAGQRMPGLMVLWRFLRISLPQLRYLLPTLRNLDPDIIHLNNGVTFAVLAARLLGVPVVVHERRIRIYTWLQRLFSRWVDALICVSEAVRENCAVQGIGGKSTVVIPNAVDPDLVRPTRDRDEMRRALGLHPDDFVVTMVANYLDWKRHIDLIKAVGLAYPSVPKLQCLIVGAPPRYSDEEFKRTRAAVACLGLEDRVRLLGFRSDVPDILGASDLLVHPAESEPFGRVIIEAMALSLPVVAVDSAGPAEIVLHGVTGLLVPARDPEQLAAAIQGLYRQPDLRVAMGSAGANRARALFGPVTHARQIEAIYQEILG